VLEDKEIIRRATTVFALPQNLKRGGDLIWGTSDLIWTTLGDTSDDYNWYSKRTILSGVYSATLLYWLGDQSDGHADTWDFLDRRIDNVMQFEKTKAKLRENQGLMRLLAGPRALLSRLQAPSPTLNDRPGTWSPTTKD
jgi:ubiquinone biosynthesis protein COQ9